MVCSRKITTNDVYTYLTTFGYRIPLCDNLLKKLVDVFHVLRILVISDQMERRLERKFWQSQKSNSTNFTETIASLLCMLTTTNGMCRVNYFKDVAAMSISAVEENLENIFTALVRHVHNKDHHHMLLAAIVIFKKCPDFGFYDEDNEIVDMLREKPKILKSDDKTMEQAYNIMNVLDGLKRVPVNGE